MKTDVIVLDGNDVRFEEALAQAEKVSVYKALSRKDSLHLRLLTEELLGLMRSVTGNRDGRFWIEDQEGVFSLHLSVRMRMDSRIRGTLIGASSTGKNENARGFMGKLRDLFDRGADNDVAALSSPLMLSGVFDHSTTPALDWEWSMTRYQENVRQQAKHDDPEAKAAWDELEKSVVRNVADEVKVSILSDKAEMVILKKLGS